MNAFNRGEDMLSDEIDAILGPDDGEEEGADLEQADDAEEEDEAPEDDAAESEEGEEGEEDSAAAEPVDAPVSWTKEDKAIWGDLPAEAQAVIQRREAERDKFVQAKSVEAAQARDRVANEARDIITKLHQESATKYDALASAIMPQKPDQRLLYSDDPSHHNAYHRQMAAYEGQMAQLQQLQQLSAQHQQAAQSAQEQSQQAERAMDAQRLREQLPEWFDSASTIQADLQSIGKELGYPDELMAEASSTDIMALKKALDWKAKAEKFDAMNKSLNDKKMEAVRAAKGLPKMAKPGVKPTKQQMNAVGKQKTWDRLKANPKDADAAADFFGL